MRVLLVTLLVACGYSPTPVPGGDDDSAPDAPGDPRCPDGKAGAACVIALHDAALAECDPAIVDELTAELDRRASQGPLWADGRALFRTAAPRAIAGTFDDWSQTAIVTAPLCGTDLVLAAGAVPSGHHAYKLYDPATQTWTLDPENPAFAYDDFAGNPDGVNSVLATHDAGRGYLVRLDRACSDALGNCRDVIAYLPPGYDAPANRDTTYPVLFMHDGQNVWSDHDCCFGHTGWELDVVMDREIAEGHVAPAIIIGAAHSTARNAEYGLDGEAAAAFMAFQIGELQPAALAQVRWNGERVAIGGSSLGGLSAMDLALAYPDIYSAAVSLSGAFWPGQDQGQALRDRLPGYGKQSLAIYLDHGGNIAANTDGAADSVEVRDLLVGLGWQRSDSPSCAMGPDSLCYFMEPGASHDELAWQARSWRFLRFVFPAP